MNTFTLKGIIVDKFTGWETGSWILVESDDGSRYEVCVSDNDYHDLLIGDEVMVFGRLDGLNRNCFETSSTYYLFAEIVLY